jgi:hypothetical protein
MMRPGRLWIVLLFCLVTGFLVGFIAPDKPIKATWIWQTDLIGTEKAGILQFAGQNGVNLIYLQIDRQKPFEFYRTFIKDARAAGIEVQALGGDPRWGLAAYREQMLELEKWVSAYNGQAADGERIPGIHLAVEPYTLPEWDKDQASILKQWMGNVDAFVAAAKADGLGTGVDLAVWFDAIAVPGVPGMTFSKWMIGKFDQTTLLAYRDTADGANGIADVVKNELDEADQLGKPVVVAVNTKADPDERKTSFAAAGPAEMRRQLELLTEQVGGHPSFAGTAIHDYQDWRDLKSASVNSKGPIMATYVWHASSVINEPDEIIRFSKENGVNLLYVRLDLEQPYAAYRDFVAKATAAGIEVHAMGGHPLWSLEPYRERMLRLVGYVKGYNGSAEADEKFHGIHLDIEPYVLPDWNQDTESVLRQWMDNIDAFVQEAKEESDLVLSCDLAIWLDQFGVPGDSDTSFSRWMINKLDQVTLMAFRNTADGPGGISAVVQDEMGFADELGKDLVVAVEMKENHEGEYVSFYQKGEAEMHRQLSKLPQLLADHPAYKGNAVHAYEYWKNAME